MKFVGRFTVGQKQIQIHSVQGSPPDIHVGDFITVGTDMNPMEGTQKRSFVKEIEEKDGEKIITCEDVLFENSCECRLLKHAHTNYRILEKNKLAGQISVSGKTVTGTGTKFHTFGVKAGDGIKIEFADRTVVLKIESVDNNTKLTLQTPVPDFTIAADENYTMY